MGDVVRALWAPEMLALVLVALCAVALLWFALGAE